MIKKTNINTLFLIIEDIIKNSSYSRSEELSPTEKNKIIEQLQRLVTDSEQSDKIKPISAAFDQEKIAKQFKANSISISLIFEMLEHEVVSASRLHNMLLELAHEEHFSMAGIHKINHYFTDKHDHGDNDNFITMSSSDIIDSISRAKNAQLNSDELHNYQTDSVRPNINQTDKVIKLSNYRNKED
ncbi:hypothetical protein OZX56_09045 [Lactobacillus sp. ESL0684]|uniref:hypothetical protein n=1 Tax=unclassified Lactobacillus TaxID=2620435 RepID=UPI0023F70AB9|nr:MULTISPECIES: hypothetical protein [unclassified Lactobacillus]WEV39844.1 hypothetical protein OZX59_06430 [Lactobacillus sp. ESL0681]WEV43631.1 hypothetical protein OZX56_09045 [Lactobacillus sp. ESL0684]